jgi:hypothetical protein
MLAITTARLLQYIAFWALTMILGIWFYEQKKFQALKVIGFVIIVIDLIWLTRGLMYIFHWK